MKGMVSIVAATGVLVGVAAVPAWAQKAGQSVTIQYGTVAGSREVDLQSGAVPKGAVVGGALGLASAGGKSSSKKARNAILGAAAGGAIAGASQGSQKGMLYDVDIGSGGRIQVVSDQREIRSGDCVAVEQAGDTANLRRVSAGYCDKASAPAVQVRGRRGAERCGRMRDRQATARGRHDHTSRPTLRATRSGSSATTSSAAGRVSTQFSRARFEFARAPRTNRIRTWRRPRRNRLKARA